jgi:hypothetical protein
MEPSDQDDTRHHNHDTSGPPTVTRCLHSADVAALRAIVDACLAGASDHSRTLVARAASALDDLRSELAEADRLIAGQQARLAELYELFAGWDGDSGSPQP